jgi:DNA-binding LacI/PurR family transcriptional regulator
LPVIDADDQFGRARQSALRQRVAIPLYHDPEVGCPAIVADNRQGVRKAVRHLIAHGHRRIAFIG